MTGTTSPHIIVLGAGFGGLTFCQSFRHSDARITLIDRQNHHLFQPLLYQVATAGLAPAEIAQPVRSIMSARPNVTVLLDQVEAIDLNLKAVRLTRRGVLTYDYLILALGGVTSYFGHPEWETFAPGLKSLEDAINIRHKVLLAFERAENEADAAVRRRLMTLVIVGGGPTGVELAGAFAELTRTVLRRDFRAIDPAQARVVLIEAGARLLSHMPEDLSESAKRQLAQLGVEVRLNALVKEIGRHRVTFNTGETLVAETILWSAGVSANALTRSLGVPLDRAGRVMVEADLSLPGHPEAFAVGDMARVLDAKGGLVPGVAPAASQMAKHTARLVEAELYGVRAGAAPRKAFRYWDKGTMATIGRSAAVAWMGPIHLSGLWAWVFWLVVHLLFLIGLRNKVAVVLQWMYSYFAYKRGARIITKRPELRESESIVTPPDPAQAA
jgi:NADH dehydrogenase